MPVTIDEIADSIARGDTQGIPLVLSSLSDEERKQYRKQIYDWYRDLHLGRETSLPTVPKSNGGRADQAAGLAVLASGNLKEAERVLIWWVHGTKNDMSDSVFQVLKDRRPKWADRWLEKRLEGETFFPWDLLERLVEENVCEKPATDDYIRFLGDRFNNFKEPLVPRLKARPQLLEDDIWRLFEVPSNAFTMEPTTYLAQRFPTAQSWATAFVELASDGTISREKLLDCSLEALARDFNQNVLSGLLNMLKELKPTAQELGRRQSILRELLASPVSHVAKFAIASLKKARPLEVEGYLRAAPPVLQLPIKGNSLNLLKHVSKLVDKNTELQGLATPLFESGTIHSHPDVREYAKLWLAEQGLHLREGTVSEEPVEIELDLESVEPRWRKMLGFEEAGFPPPLAYPESEVPRLSGLQKLLPIEELQELIDAVAAGTEEMPDGQELERILGGLCRLCDLLPPDFQARTEALLKRISEYQATETVRGLVAGYAGVSALVRHLLLLWLSDAPVPLVESTYYRPINLYPFIRARFEELFARVAKRRAAPMLCEPTHERGWIEPLVLVQRLQTYPAEPGEADLIQALLRLAPCGREAALALARDLKGWYADPLRWALGADFILPPKVKQPEVWLAACRAREPLLALNWKALDFLPPEALIPIEFQWETKWVGEEYKFPRFGWQEAGEPRPGAVGALMSLLTGNRYRLNLMPTWLAQRHPEIRNWESVDLQSPWISRWLGLLWPADLRAYWRLTADCLVERLDMDTSSTFPNFAWFEPLFEQDRTWSTHEYLVVCLGLIGKDNDVMGLAVDAAIEAVADGRLHPEPFSEVMLRLYRAGWVKPNRLAASLGEVARVTTLHRRIVAEVVGELLSQPPGKGGHHLLQLMLEVADGLPSSTREQLKQLSGTGKTAKLARKLLDLGEPSALDEYRSMALKGRLERARRWGQVKD